MSTNPNFGVWRPMAENVEFNALESNSNAVMAVADTVRTTLGPKGLDKLYRSGNESARVKRWRYNTAFT